MIERCHRGSKKEDEEDEEDDKIRPIFVKFYSWNDAQHILNRITKLRIKK